MRLTPTQLDRLTIFTAAELARRRRTKAWKLKHREALAIIGDGMRVLHVEQPIGPGRGAVGGDAMKPGEILLRRHLREREETGVLQQEPGPPWGGWRPSDFASA